MKYEKRKRFFHSNISDESNIIYSLAKAEFRKQVREYKGEGHHNPRIVQYHSVTGLKASNDETPWCASFLCWILDNAGLPHPASASSQSFLNWGSGVPFDKIKKGDIVVFKWPNRRGGHVGIVENIDSDGKIRVLGGNQNDEISTKPFSTEHVISYRRYNYIEPKVKNLVKKSRTIKGATVGAVVATTTATMQAAENSNFMDAAISVASKGGELANKASWVSQYSGYLVSAIMLIILAWIVYARIDDWKNKGR